MTGIAANKPARALSPRRPSRSRKKLLEWGVVYPVLIGSLLTAGPQWIDSLRAASQGIHVGTVEDAQKQAHLWRKNLACAGAPFAWFNNPSNIKVDATICDSGDIFVRASTPDNTQYFKWLPLSDVLQAGGGEATIIPAANAAVLLPAVSPSASQQKNGAMRLAQTQAKVICQKFVDDRHLLRRVQTPEGCFDEVIDTFNGSVLSRKPAPCTPDC